MTLTPTAALVAALFASLISASARGQTAAPLWIDPAVQADGANRAVWPDDAAPLTVQPSVSTSPLSAPIDQSPGSVWDDDAAQRRPPATREPEIRLGNDRVIAPPGTVGRVRSGPRTSFKFEDAPIAEVASVILGDVAKTDFVFHGQISGTVTLGTRAPVTPDQAVFLLETALQANGLVLARDARGTYHIGKPEALRDIVSAPRQAIGGVITPGTGTVIVPLRYIGANEMASILRPIAGADAIVRVDSVRNLLVMSGSRTQAEGWLDIVSTFDIDMLKGMSVGVFPLKYASVGEVSAALQVLSGGSPPAQTPSPSASPTQRPGGRGREGAPASTAATSASAATAAAAGALGEDNPLYGALRILPIERINSILVVTPRAAYLEEARRWIERLDRPGAGSNEPQLHVYAVQNGSARHLAAVLGSIYGGSSGPGAAGATGALGVAPGLGTTGAFGGAGTFGSQFGGLGATSFNSGFGTGGLGTSGFGGTFATGGLGSANSMGAFGGVGAAGRTAAMGAQTGGVSAVTLGGNVRVVADEANNSVLVYAPASEFAKIEATLKRLDIRAAQVLIEASIIEVTLRDNLKYGLEWTFKNSFDGNRVGAGALQSSSTTALGGALPQGFSYTLTGGNGYIRGVLQALATDSLVKVISSPSLMVMDNQVASIMVGDQQPIQSGTTVSTGGFVSSNIQYKDTGVQLQILPSINAGNIVTMQLMQAVTDVASVQDPATGQYPFRQRQITSKVAVRSGEALVLGGLIRDNTSNGRNGIPFLKDLPVIGAAFSTTAKATDRTELLVIITPRVIRADADIRDVGAEMRERMQGIFNEDRREGVRRSPLDLRQQDELRRMPGVERLPNPTTYFKTPD